MFMANVREIDNKQNRCLEQKEIFFNKYNALVEEIEKWFGVDIKNYKKQKMYVGNNREIGFCLNYWKNYEDTKQRFSCSLWVELNHIIPITLKEFRKLEVVEAI